MMRHHNCSLYFHFTLQRGSNYHSYIVNNYCCNSYKVILCPNHACQDKATSDEASIYCITNRTSHILSVNCCCFFLYSAVLVSPTHCEIPLVQNPHTAAYLTSHIFCLVILDHAEVLCSMWTEMLVTVNMHKCLLLLPLLSDGEC